MNKHQTLTPTVGPAINEVPESAIAAQPPPQNPVVMIFTISTCTSNICTIKSLTLKKIN